MANQSKTLTMSCQQPQPFGSSPLGSVSPGGSSIIGGVGGGIGGGGVGGGGLGPDGKLNASYYGGSQHSLPGLTQPPRQKGRPRKRKPKDLEAMTANLGELTCVLWDKLFVDHRRLTRQTNDFYHLGRLRCTVL